LDRRNVKHDGNTGWIGASLRRKEDARYLLGHGMFIADVQVPGVQDVAFVRSPVAHARILKVSKPATGRVLTLADLGPVNVLEAGPELSAHRHSPYPPLADERVRYVGQTIAACVMPTRAQAEDVAEAVELELEQLPAVVDVVAAMRPDSPRVFEEWPSNAYIGGSVVEGDPQVLAAAPVRLHRLLRLNRQASVSMEGRGALAYWDRRRDELVVYLSTQGGQVKRMALAKMLGLPEHKVRVIAPDIGGGFGGKNRIMPEDVAVAALALKLGHPVRWIEDRREHLLASPHARDHTYDLTLCAERDGTLLGIEGDIYVDAGAYALWPTGASQEASMASRNLTGPYRMRHLKLNTHTVATNKAPMGPYRGVARPGATFALERLVDEMARDLGREPFDLRMQNIVTSAELPYKTAAGMKLDTGDYVAALKIARDQIDLAGMRKRQAAGRMGAGSASALRSTPSRAATALSSLPSANSVSFPATSPPMPACCRMARSTSMSACRTTARATRLRCRRSPPTSSASIRRRFPCATATPASGRTASAPSPPAPSCSPAARSAAPAARWRRKSAALARICCRRMLPRPALKTARCMARPAASASPRSPSRPTPGRTICRPA
jgi:carbon-monoxide dehydrogenase large subunit